MLEDKSLKLRRRFQFRLLFAFFVVTGFFIVLLARLFYLQILEHEKYLYRAENNSTASIAIAPARGVIYDRNGLILADNYSAYTLEIDPKFAADIPGFIESLKGVISFSDKDIMDYKRQLRQPNTDTIILKNSLNDVELAKFAAIAYRYPELKINARLFRVYPYGKLSSHFLGYIGRIDENDKAKLNKEGRERLYRGSQYIGKAGIEAQYEKELHGIPGWHDVQVNSLNRVSRVLSTTPEVNGADLQLSLDIKLQEYASELVGNRRGAVVALDPRNGEILAFLSKPSFDPHSFITGISREEWDSLNNNWRKPLLNRVTQGLYPPGSTFKPFLALGALELGIRTPTQLTYDPGYFVLPGSTHRFRDSSRKARGNIDIKRAIQVSSDTYFYKLAWDMGIDNIASQIARFGLGSKTGVDIPNELGGVLPSREWKKRRFASYEGGGAWLAGDVVSVGIGQGFNAYTPIQLAFATSIIANNGLGYRPHFVKKIVSRSMKINKIVNPELSIDAGFNPNNLEVIKDALKSVLQPGGTAFRVGRTIKGYVMAGKTGTAQVIQIKQDEKYQPENLDLRYRDHSLFISYAPADNPKIALAVVIENGGWGASAALPIAKKLTDYYLLGVKAPPEGAYSPEEDEDPDLKSAAR